MSPHAPNTQNKPATLHDLQELLKATEKRLTDVLRFNHNTTEAHLVAMETCLMSVISDLAARIEADTTATAEGLAKINTAVEKLDALVTQLQGTQGQITAEDQAILDKIETGVKGLRAMTEAAVATTEDGVPPNQPPVEE